MTVQENISLLPFNTFGVDVKAGQFIQVTNIDEAREVLSEKKYKVRQKLILGGGSNVLFTRDFDGLILRNGIMGRSIAEEDGSSVVLDAGSGENWHSLVMYCVERNYGGIENLSLIPGSVGAGPMQNIGAYGVEIKDCVEEVEFMDLSGGELHIYDAGRCEFGYRNSIFKKSLAGKVLITRVRLRLSRNPRFNTAYGDIEAELKRLGGKVSVKNVSQAVINIRRSKLPDPAELGNAGSFFKNPVVEESLVNSLKSEFADLPLYAAGEGKFKLAAGWLIEKAGWKGRRTGNCGVHNKQALVLVNYGGARGNEILQLAEEIASDVQSKFGIVLEREVNVY